MEATSNIVIPADWVSNKVVLDAFPSGVVICDQQGTIVYCNSELLQMFGYLAEELQGQPIEMLLPENSRQIHPEHFRRFMASPQKRSMGLGRDLNGQRKNGSTFPIEIGLNPIDTTAGKQVIASIADISERQQLVDNFRKVVESAPVGMLIVDTEGKISHANQYLLEIFGYRHDELIGRSLEILLPERYREGHVKQRTAYSNEPMTRAMGAERDLTGLHKLGTEIPVEIGLNPILTESGMMVIAAVSDITERKKTENQLRQMNADLDEFTYVASHDLKSPLRGISSLLEWIEEDLGGNVQEDIKNNLDRIHIRIDRMEKLIEDLLAYARSGRQQRETNKINLGILIDDIITMIDPSENFTVRVNGFLEDIQTAATPLETVLRNLVSNAIKHHDRDHGEITIDIAIEDAYCIFSIIDDGPGIPSNAHQRVFKLFQTLSSQDGTRSGVGLAVCKRLIEAQGGKIELISEDSQRGTCFRFWWPRFARRDLND